MLRAPSLYQKQYIQLCIKVLFSFPEFLPEVHHECLRYYKVDVESIWIFLKLEIILNTHYFLMSKSLQKEQ